MKTPRQPVDPIRSFDEAADELHISPSTLRRRILPTVEVVEMSPRRRGLRQSVIERIKLDRTRPPVR
jgi:hypothetical protein